MLRNLQTNGSTFANGQNKAKVQMVRGAFATVKESTQELELATGIAGAKIVDRGTKLTKELAMGFNISPYDTDQDTILVGERAYLNELEGRWMTTEYDATTVNATLAVGSYLSIASGKLIASTANAVTIIKFIGIINDNGHSLAGFEIDTTAKLA